jgi:predicted dehydrogenase
MGLGVYANIVAEAMLSCKKAKIVGLISGTPSKLEKWSKYFNIKKENCYNYENYDNIINNEEIDAVYILTPNALHKEMAIKVAQAKKHVIVEKPMAINSTECIEMINVCSKFKVKLLVGYRMHFEPNTLEIVRLRESNYFGKILYFQALTGFKIGDPNQWRLDKKLSGGGALMDVGIYCVNGSRYMLGEEPIWVTAQETKTDKIKFKDGIDETIQFQLGFPSGAIASCMTSYSQNNINSFFLNGTDGFVEMNPANNYGPIVAKVNSKELTFATIKQQTLQMDAFADYILNDILPKINVDGIEGMKDVKIIEAIYNSIKLNKKIILN